MARIRAEELANYVEYNRKKSIDILKLKNIDASYNDSLDEVVDKIAQLRDKEIPEVDYPQEYKDLMSDYENDPLMVFNGGKYEVCIFYLIKNLYSTTMLDLYYKSRVITSDGQDFERTTRNTLITWDTTKDLYNSSNEGYRWIKCYYTELNYNNSYSNMFVNGCYPSNNIEEVSPLRMVLLDGKYHATYSGSASTANWSYLGLTPVDCIVCGYNSNITLGTNNLYDYNHIIWTNLKNLRYIKDYSNHGISFEGINSTTYRTQLKILEGTVRKLTGCDLRTPIHLSTNMTSLSTLITSSQVILDTDILVFKNAENLSSTGMQSLFSGTSIFNTIKSIQFPKLKSGQIYIGNSSPSPKIIEVVFNDNYDDEIIILANKSYVNSCGIENLVIPNNYHHTLNLQNGFYLTKECLLNIFNRVADLTGETSLVIILPTYQKFNVTDEELAIATNKNWTVTFA